MSSIALITGGNRGLGLASARALARAGSTVVIAGRDQARVRDAAAQLRADGLDAEWLVLDVTSPSSVAGAAGQVRQRHGRLDILVNNAGILPEAASTGQHEFADPAVFRATFETNVAGPVSVIEAFLPLLRNSAAGRVVNVSTTMGSLTDQSNPDSPYYQLVVPAYQSSKAALNSITIGLSKKLAGTGIKVTSVCPGFVQTDLTPMNREQAPLTADQAAEVVVRAATLPGDAPSGTFIGRDGPVPW
jgi:NAD(P)-dependent dehydrogenase (short-subunit alcohol dehydrogenase family)